MLVLGGDDPAHRLAGVAGFLEQPPGLVLVVLVVERGADLGVPRHLLEEQAGIDAIEVLVADAGQDHRLHVECGLRRLAQLEVGHQPLLHVEDNRGHPYGLTTTVSTPGDAFSRSYWSGFTCWM